MSDQDVLLAIEAMERLLQTPDSDLSSDAIRAWQVGFETAVASAERGPHWNELIQRAHDTAHAIELRLDSLRELRDSIRQELNLGAQGSRALRAYDPGRM